MTQEILQQIGRASLVPVVVIDRPDDAVPLAQALLDGGLACIEITLRTDAAMECIRRIAAKLPQMLIGAGTVLTIEQAQQSIDAGARFLVAPGFDPDLVDWCLENKVLILPGVATPTDVTMAYKRGLRVLKFFPSDVFGGPKAIKAIGGPFGDVLFVPTGGINMDTLPDYLRQSMILAAGGSWLVSRELIANRQFDTITELTRRAVDMVRSIRG